MDEYQSPSTSFEISQDNLLIESKFVMLVAEQNGRADLSEKAAADVSVYLINLIQSILSVAKKFKDRGRRRMLSSEDVDSSILFHGLSPFFGYQLGSNMQFKYVGTIGREIFVRNDPEIDLNSFINLPLPKLPLKPSIKSHWLVIDGVQPAIPENPYLPNYTQTQSVNADNVQNTALSTENETEGFYNRKRKNSSLLLNNMSKVVRKTEQIQIKTTTTHALSLEQQVLFKEITEAVMGNDETKRLEALNCLMTDCGIQILLPRFSIIIAEGVRCNIAQHNLAILIYLMRMVQSLLQNETISLERCLHELLPAIMSCILSRQLCSHVQSDNHWALREFSARLLATITKKYEYLSFRSRITKALSRAFHDPNCSLATLYGAVFALNQLGTDTTRSVVAPQADLINSYISRACNDSNISSSEKKAAERLRAEMTSCMDAIEH